MRTTDRVVLASTNPDKLNELRPLFSGFFPDVALVPIDELVRNADKLGIVEQFATYAENATAKARRANHACHFPCLADDSGLEVAALQGDPGPRTARYATPKAGESQDHANIAKLLTALKGRPMDARGARFVCHLVFVMEGILVQAAGTLEGRIAEAPSGTGGFGYDPIFIPSGETKTLAELGDDYKKQHSHRALAFQTLAEQINHRGILFTKP